MLAQCVDKLKATLAKSALESNRQIVHIDAVRGEPILDQKEPRKFMIGDEIQAHYVAE